MARFLKRFLIVAGAAALVALGIVLWKSPDPGYTVQTWLAGSRFSSYDQLIRDASQKHGVDPMLLKAIVWRESAFKPDKVGTSGERGLMQVGEAAARDWAKSQKIETFEPTDLFDPKTNLDVGAWYLRKALDRWKQKADPVPFALAEYNAGHGRVERWVTNTNRGDDATAGEFMRTIDFPSTRKYIDDIVAREKYYQTIGRL